MGSESIVVDTTSGKLIDLHYLRPYDILLSDVVHGTGLVRRFNGLSNGDNDPVTSLQHSYAMYLFAKRKYPDNHELAIECLVSSAPSAYVGDIARDLKFKLPVIYQIEQRVFESLSEVYGLPTPSSDEVAKLDELAHRVEWREFVTRSDDPEDYEYLVMSENVNSPGADDLDYDDMKRALLDAREYTQKQLADEVLLILYGEVVLGVRNKFKKKHQEETLDSIIAMMAENQKRASGGGRESDLDPC